MKIDNMAQSLLIPLHRKVQEDKDDHEAKKQITHQHHP